MSVNPPDPLTSEKGDPTGQDLTLRTNLVIEEVAEQGTKYFVIKDPAQQRFFQIKELEHFLITQFDGKTSFDEDAGLRRPTACSSARRFSAAS